jgi:hypothetical protein
MDLERKFPKWESLKNKYRKSGMFFEPEKWPSTYQLSPAIHHKFTIKKPRSAHRFCQNPQQKRVNQLGKKLLRFVGVMVAVQVG